MNCLFKISFEGVASKHANIMPPSNNFSTFLLIRCLGVTKSQTCCKELSQSIVGQGFQSLTVSGSIGHKDEEEANHHWSGQRSQAFGTCCLSFGVHARPAVPLVSER
ncbi:hypothetical protein CI102_2655 [Trichoderma harzianum]|nr:hypothetical protein CI102_2655 [Trichoderma harzianum]